MGLKLSRQAEMMTKAHKLGFISLHLKISFYEKVNSSIGVFKT